MDGLMLIPSNGAGGLGFQTLEKKKGKIGIGLALPRFVIIAYLPYLAPFPSYKPFLGRRCYSMGVLLPSLCLLYVCLSAALCTVAKRCKIGL